VHVERLWPDTRLRNYHYLVVCEETGEALAVDPFDAPLMLDAARRHGWQITQVLNTHHHDDHVAGNDALRAATGAKVLAHADAASLIPGGIDRGLAEGDVIRVGRSIELQCLDTPGHTLSHVCLFAHADQPALFCGDTLFNAGAGNCHSGDPVALYETFATRLASLPDATQVFAGHDYLINNLGFTLAREPDNTGARALRERLAATGPLDLPVTTLAEEKQFNTFFRLGNPQIIAGLREHFPDLPEEPTPREVFVALRALRNQW